MIKKLPFLLRNQDSALSNPWGNRSVRFPITEKEAEQSYSVHKRSKTCCSSGQQGVHLVVDVFCFDKLLFGSAQSDTVGKVGLTEETKSSSDCILLRLLTLLDRLSWRMLEDLSQIRTSWSTDLVLASEHVRPYFVNIADVRGVSSAYSCCKSQSSKSLHFRLT